MSGDGIKKPDQVYPLAEKSVPYAAHMPEIISDPSIHGDAFDQLIKNRGIRFIHKKAMPCPNLRSLNDNSHDPNCPFCDNSQVHYFSTKEIFGTWAGNRLEKMFEVQGVWEIGSAVISFPTQYTDGKQADFNTFDQLTIPDFEIRMNDVFEYEPRTNRQQKLRYPINSVEHMTSVVNGVLMIYEVGIDFNLVNGNIEWVVGQEPAYNSTSETGEVISISYCTNPVYTVINILHELRATQEMGSDGVKRARRLQQQVLVKRDFLVNQDVRKRETTEE